MRWRQKRDKKQGKTREQRGQRDGGRQGNRKIKMYRRQILKQNVINVYCLHPFHFFVSAFKMPAGLMIFKPLPLRTSSIFLSLLSSHYCQSCSFILSVLSLGLFHYPELYLFFLLWLSFCLCWDIELSCLLSRDWWLQTAVYPPTGSFISLGSIWLHLIFCQTLNPSNECRASYAHITTALPSRKAGSHVG